jgi:Domain of unknown function (DUF3387)
MAAKYVGRLAVAENGERFALVVDSTTGILHFRASVFSTTMRRVKGLAANSLLSDCRCLARTLTWADRCGIDLVERFEAGIFLTLAEVDDFVASTKLPLTELYAVAPPDAAVSRRRTGMEAYRARAQKPARGLKAGTSAFQIWISGKYFKWLADNTALGLSEDEVRFYDALANNESAVRELTDETLKKIAHELAENLRKNLTVDWSARESVQAKLRLMVKRILRKYKYPPDQQEAAVELVLQQARVMGEAWV